MGLASIDEIRYNSLINSNSFLIYGFAIPLGISKPRLRNVGQYYYNVEIYEKYVRMFYIFAAPNGHVGYLGIAVYRQEVLRSFPRYDNANFYTSSRLNTSNLHCHFPRSDRLFVRLTTITNDRSSSIQTQLTMSFVPY